MQRVDLIYFDAGGGHRSAATALRLAIEQQGRPWETRLVNLQEVLDPLDIVRKLSGLRLQDLYNLMLNKGWTLGSPSLTRLLQAIIRQYHPAEVHLLEPFWRRSRPDLVVSLVPHFNRALFESLGSASPATPFATILTDFADYPPHFWMERQEQFLICGTDRAVEQARALGYPEWRVLRASGMIVHPRFLAPMRLDRAAERRRLGLEPERPTGLVLFGGQGSAAMFEIARWLDRAGLDLQLILICGRNGRVAERLRGYRSGIPIFVEGFTKEVPYYMGLSDFFIGKPGPGSLSEAIAMQLPVIVERNAWTLPQERYNAAWILEKQIGLVVPSFRKVAQAAEKLLAPQHFNLWRAHTAALQPRAVLEIPAMLERILSGKDELLQNHEFSTGPLTLHSP
jgi:1,2-diacylglycerol 3-beta-galactosyltransferase